MQNLKMFTIFTCVSVGSLIHGVNPEETVKIYPHDIYRGVTVREASDSCLGGIRVEKVLTHATLYKDLLEVKPVGLSLELNDKTGKSEIGRLDVSNFAWSENGESSAYIDNLAVRPQDQRKGVGRMLLDGALGRLEKLQAQCVVENYDFTPDVENDDDAFQLGVKDYDGAVAPTLEVRRLSYVTLKAEPDKPADLERLCKFYTRYGFEEQGKRAGRSVDMIKRFDTHKR